MKYTAHTYEYNRRPEPKSISNTKQLSEQTHPQPRRTRTTRQVCPWDRWLKNTPIYQQGVAAPRMTTKCSSACKLLGSAQRFQLDAPTMLGQFCPCKSCRTTAS